MNLVCVFSHGQFLVHLSSSKENAKEILVHKWPSCALWRMLVLVEETPTHHRHYFRSQDINSLYRTRLVFQWISRQFLNKKSYPSQNLSYFLVRSEEIPLFLVYVDNMIRSQLFDIVTYDLKKNYFVINFHFPFKNRILGLSFSKDSLTHLFTIRKACYLKIIFRADHNLATIYPIALE